MVAEHRDTKPMIAPIRRATLFALYQLSIVLGILLLPLAILARQGGITIPVHRLVDTLGRAYRDGKPA